MKNYGLKTIIFISALIITITCGYFMFKDIEGASLPFIFSFVLSVYSLINAPLVTISEKRICISNLNPVYKDIKVNVSEVNKAIVDINDYKFRLTLEMNDGTFRSIRTIRFYDMKPIYYALRRTGLPIETNGIGTIDWA